MDSDLEEEEKVRVRVTTYECYPLEPENNKAVFSTTRNTIFYTFNEFLKTADTVKAVANTNKQVKVAALERVYVETSEVVVDTVNDPYNGVYVINGYFDGTIYAGDTKDTLNRAGLFFPKPDANVGSGVNGGVLLYNKNGVGFQFDDDDTTPKVRYGGSGITSPILTSLNNIDSLFDVVVTSPQPAQTLIYNVATQKWINASLLLETLSNIEINNPQNGQSLKYDATTQKWKNSF